MQTFASPTGDLSSTPPRVLTADPDDRIRARYRALLGGDGWDVVEASEGREALVKALVHVPSLVISELRLPLIDGFAFCDILRRDRTTAKVPIVVVTQETSRAELQRAHQVADLVLTKPTDEKALLKECALLARVHRVGERAAATCRRASEAIGITGTLLRTSAERQRPPKAVKAHLRYMTTVPPEAPPALRCVSCDRPLSYEVSYVGGVSVRQPEQWDYFICATCGTFQYRHRTRKMRRLRIDEEEWLKRNRSA